MWGEEKRRNYLKNSIFGKISSFTLEKIVMRIFLVVKDLLDVFQSLSIVLEITLSSIVFSLLEDKTRYKSDDVVNDIFKIMTKHILIGSLGLGTLLTMSFNTRLKSSKKNKKTSARNSKGLFAVKEATK